VIVGSANKDCECGKATILGANADLVIVDVKRRATITKELLHTITPRSVYEGWDVTG
jgi:dihydroorotase-like cyclic amidohydrolase